MENNLEQIEKNQDIQSKVFTEQCIYRGREKFRRTLLIFRIILILFQK